MSGVIRLGNFSFGTRFKINRTINVIVHPQNLKIAVFDDTDVVKIKEVQQIQGATELDYEEYMYDTFLLSGFGHVYSHDHDFFNMNLYSDLADSSLVDSQLIFDNHHALGKYLIVFQNYLYELVFFNPEKISSIYPSLSDNEIITSTLRDAWGKGFNSNMVFDALASR